MSDTLTNELGDELYRALRAQQTVQPLTERHTLTVEQAYRISLRFLLRRQQDGEVVIGKKLASPPSPCRTCSTCISLTLAFDRRHAV